MTPDDRHRVFLGLLLAAHDGDEVGFRALLRGVPRAELLTMIRSLTEVVISGQLAMEEWPGDARRQLAHQALIAAVRD